jgi:hypothetical protein
MPVSIANPTDRQSIIAYVKSQTEIVSPSPHFCRATSAALMPSSARPKVTPLSMMRRSFWVSAMRV